MDYYVAGSPEEIFGATLITGLSIEVPQFVGLTCLVTEDHSTKSVVHAS
jgi:hypothetical protein